MASWILDNLPSVVNHMNKLIPSDYIFYSTDTKKILYMDESHYPAAALGKPGMDFADNSTSDMVVKTKQRVEREIDAKLYGFALKTIDSPAKTPKSFQLSRINSYEWRSNREINTAI